MGYTTPSLAFILMATILLLCSCTDEPSGPKPPDTPTGPDTTTHNWRFEVDTLGENYSGAREVIAFSKDDAWACGDFEIERKPGDWVRYPLAHWDGTTWKLVMLTVPGHNIPEDGYTIYGHAPNDLWFVASRLYQSDGVNWTGIPPSETNITKGISQMWGTNSEDMYFIGREGTLTHYNGEQFNPIPTPTDIDLDDIWGDGGKIYMVGRNSSGTRSVWLEYSQGAVSLLDTAKTLQDFQYESVWYNARDSVIGFAGYPNLLQTKDTILTPHVNDYVIPYTHKIRGTGINNVWIVGDFSCVIHFNGSTWKRFKEFDAFSGANITSLVVFEDYLFASGYGILGGKYKGIAIRGYKN